MKEKYVELKCEKEMTGLLENTMKELISIRKRKKITQEEIACKTGMVQQQISKIEKLKSTPSLKTVLKYADALDCSISFVENK